LVLRRTGAALVLQPHRRLHPVPGRGRSPGLIGGAARSLARGHESLLREEWSQRTEQRNNQRGEKRRPMGAEATIAGRQRHRRQNPPWAPIHGPIASASTSASAPGNLPHPSGGALVDCTTARRRRKEATVAAMAGPHGKLTHPAPPSLDSSQKWSCRDLANLTRPSAARVRGRSSQNTAIDAMAAPPALRRPDAAAWAQTCNLG